MDLRYDTPMSAANACNVTPTRGDLGVPGAKLITPANPAASVLYLRMNRRGANQMPPVGSNLVDTDGAALLEQWIQQMDGACN
jgi:mono/diheme cytochrome c family protein